MGDSVPKRYFVGVDEAGYGPNLGPLVVAASLWSAPLDFSERRLSRSLARIFLPSTWTAGCKHVPLGDSKQLYQAGNGLATLEAGLLAMQYLYSDPCFNLGQLLNRAIPSDRAAELHSCPWYKGCAELPIPKSLTDNHEPKRLSAIAAAKLARLGLKLVGMSAAVVTESHFNASVAHSGSKGQLLSQTTLALVAHCLKQCELEQVNAPVEVYCDRHGGRKNYLPNLFDAMPDEWFMEVAVGDARSSYQNCGDRSIRIHFTVGGDRFAPTGLASMLAKYLRERLMEQLNLFWQQHLPTLKPTAGYPLDAQRFRNAIEPVAAQLQLTVESWWRCK